MSKYKYPPIPTPAFLGGFSVAQMHAYADAAITSDRNNRGVPDGWQVVPVKPTDAMAVAAQPATRQEPPLLGRWHHGNGVLCSGTLRIATWDCDTNPPDEFRDEVLDWVCSTLTAAITEPAAQPLLTDVEICDVAKLTETAEPGRDGYILPVALPEPSSPPMKPRKRHSMIELSSYNNSGTIRHYVAPENIARITEAGVNSQWHGIRSIVKLYDGETLEVSESADWIANRINEHQSKKHE